jgi:aspartate carbamoyltransferase catalytic subunit
VRSLSYLLSKFDGVELTFVAPPAVAMGRDIKAHLDERGTPYRETEDLEAVLPEANVVYQTRIQKERFAGRMGEFRRVSGVYVMDARMLGLMRPDAILMHPLPRVGEIAPEVDEDPRAAYFRQAANGLYIRMALLRMLVGGDR